VSDDSQVFCFVTPCNTRTYPEVGALPVRKSWRGAFLFAAHPTIQARFERENYQHSKAAHRRQHGIVIGGFMFARAATD